MSRILILATLLSLVGCSRPLDKCAIANGPSAHALAAICGRVRSEKGFIIVDQCVDGLTYLNPINIALDFRPNPKWEE